MTLDLSSVIDVFRAISDSIPYRSALVFYGAYPITMACVWIVLSISFARRRERTVAANDAGVPDAPLVPLPFVSVLVPAHREAETIGRTLDALLAMDYPAYEVIVVNDGSPDATAAVVRRYLHTGVVRLLDKTVNEGKAMGLNDAIPLCRGEIIVVLDADIVVTPGVLRALVPHFESPRVGAVTGNPRVSNRGSLLRNLQTLEFASIVSVQRRAQSLSGCSPPKVWGVNSEGLLRLALTLPSPASGRGASGSFEPMRGARGCAALEVEQAHRVSIYPAFGKSVAYAAMFVYPLPRL